MRYVSLLFAAIPVWAANGFAEEPPAAKAESKHQASLDSAVLETVFKDLLTAHDSPLDPPRPGARREIFFYPAEFKEDADFSEEAEVSHALRQKDRKKWKKLSNAQHELVLHAGRNLVHRRKMKGSFSGLKFKDPRIVLWDKARDDAEDENDRRNRRRQVFHVSPPGYSQNEEVAIVNFSFPWSIHGGTGTYVLARKGNDWVILIRDFGYGR